MTLRTLESAPEYEDAGSWWENLGWRVYCDQHDIIHPCCETKDLDDYERDEDVLRAVLARRWDVSISEVSLDGGDADWRCKVADYLSAIEYARASWDTAVVLESLLVTAIAAHARGDETAVVEALSTASHLENEYGDDPATRGVREQLIEEEE